MFKNKQQKFKIENVTCMGDGLRKLYAQKLLPLETSYKFHELFAPKLDDADFTGVPMIMFVGQYSTGKTTFIKYLLGEEFPECRIGPEPTTDRFIAIMHGPRNSSVPGNAAIIDPKKPFRSLSQFGNNFLQRFTVAEMPNELLKGLTIIDTPGILSGEKQTTNRGYDFITVVKSIGERCDRIYLLFDAHKLDISDEFRNAIYALKEYEPKIRIILNKADRVDYQELMRVYGALMWSLGKILQTPEVTRVFIGSFWDEPYLHDYYKKLFECEENDLMNDMKNLPTISVTRKLNDFISRTRLATTNAYILTELAKQMPSMFFKNSKKSELLNNLPSIFQSLQISRSIPAGDFPDPEEFKQKLENFDLTKFPPLKQKTIDEITEMLEKELPMLYEKIPQEENYQEGKSSLKGGIFKNMVDDTVVDGPLNPFQINATAKLMLGTDINNWPVEPHRDKYMEIFQSLNPVDGYIKGPDVHKYLQATKMPGITLMKIWKLSDIDEDGRLDADEFALCNYLVDIQLNGVAIPSELPPTLVPPSKRNVTKS